MAAETAPRRDARMLLMLMLLLTVMRCLRRDRCL